MDLRFSLVDYLTYVNSKDNSRTVIEGEQVLNAGHVILCGVIEENSDRLKVCALCLQTSALYSSPHEIEILFTITKDQFCRVESANCSCKAGKSARCKHVSAVLILCTRKSLGELERISQTDIACAWTTQKKDTQEKYRAVPICEMPCFKDKFDSSSVEISNNILQKIKSNFLEGMPSALSMHKVGRKSQKSPSDEVNSDTYDTIILNHACQSVLMMELSLFHINFSFDCCEITFATKFSKITNSIIVDTKHSKTHWKNERQFRITGSRTHEIFTYRGQNWSKKCERYFFPKIFSNKFVRHGLDQEKVAREVFQSTTGLHVVECGLVVSEFNTWLGFSPDGIILDARGNPDALLEIKCPFSGSKNTLGEIISTLNYLEFKNNTYCLKKNHQYYSQLQTGMALLNLTSSYFTIFCSFDKSMAIIETEYNHEFSKILLFNIKHKFYENMLHEICKTIK